MCNIILDCKTETVVGFLFFLLQNTKSCHLFAFQAFRILLLNICGQYAQHKKVSFLLIIFSSVLY